MFAAQRRNAEVIGYDQAMADLTNPKLIYLKAVLFLLIGFISCALILLESPHWRTAALLVIAIWAFARLYYFAFYVIGHYVDPSYRFAGLGSFLRYLMSRPRSRGG